MEQNFNVGLLVPKILNLDKTTYQQTKLLPTPFNLFASRFFPKFLNKFLNRNYILDVYNKNIICNIPNLSGAFLVLRVNTLKQVGFFDNRYFLYLEDVDLVRRFHSISKTIYFPYATVYHIHAKMSFKLNISFLYHLLSAIKYFNKWGWFIDKDRVIVNKLTLSNLNF
jgi:GT2 family glycosyltransferase